MAKLRTLLLPSCLLVAGACNPDSSALDSSENLITSPRNVVQALTLDVPWACWQVSLKENEESFLITPTQWLRLLKAAECENRLLNEQYPLQTRITVAVHMPHRTADSLLYLRQAPLYFSDSTMGKAASQLLRLAGIPDSIDPSTIVIESATGRYTISGYLRAIRTTTPLIILLPMKIKGQKVTPAIYEAACARVRMHVLF
jgi:hypothetical protein